MKFNLFIKYRTGGTEKIAKNSNEDFELPVVEKNDNNLIL